MGWKKVSHKQHHDVRAAGKAARREVRKQAKASLLDQFKGHVRGV